ncbi:MAG: lytic transglycosylase domain-containing protein [bacterium]
MRVVMLERINGILNQISSLNREFDNVRSLPAKMGKSLREEINSSLPDFARVLEDKKEGRKTASLKQLIDGASRRQGVDSELIVAVMEAESDFDPEAVSSKGARGLMQLMPDTAAELGVDPDDPQQNIEGGTRYLGQMISRYGELDKALAAYNAGPGQVDSYDEIPPFQETQNYVNKVLQRYRQLKQSGELRENQE